MDAELKAQWLIALRSGEYEQGVGQLRNHDNTFCCLGVLCDIIDPAQWDGDEWDGKSALLPESTAVDVFGEFEDQANVDGSFRTEDGQLSSLAALNDNGKTFAEIADIIEEKF